MSDSDPVICRTTNSVDETRALGRALGERLAGGLVIGLTGPLGAGKTQLVKGIAVGNGLPNSDQVTSPTFTLIQEYDGSLAIYHLDAYRLESVSAFTALGFDELIRPDTAVIVEWADRVRPALPHDAIWITMAPTGDHQRRIEFRGPPAPIEALTDTGL